MQIGYHGGVGAQLCTYFNAGNVGFWGGDRL